MKGGSIMEENNEYTSTEQLTVPGHTAEWQKLTKQRNLKSSKRKLKKSVKVLIILFIVLVLLFGGAFVYYKFFKADSEDIYKGLLKSAYITANETINEELKDTSNEQSLNGFVSLNSNMKELKDLNGSSVDFLLEPNEKEKMIALNVIYKEIEKEILNANFYFKDKKLYIDSKQIYKKPLITSDIPIKYNFGNVEYKKQLENTKYLLNKTNRYLKKSIPDSIFKTEYGKVSIEGKNAFVQKNIMILSGTDTNKIKNKFLKKVLKDEKYIDILSTQSGLSSIEITNSLEEKLKEDISKEVEDINVEIDTNLITDKFLKLNVLSEKDPVIEVTKQKKDTYLFKGYDEGKTLIEGTIKEKEKSIIIDTTIDEYNYNIEIADDSKVTINMKNKQSEYAKIVIKLDETSEKVKKLSPKKATEVEKLSASEEDILDKNIEKLIKSSKLFTSLYSSVE